VFYDPEAVIDFQGLSRFEDGPAVTDQPIWCAMHADRGKENHQIGRQILRAGDRTRQHCPAVVFEDRDRVDLALTQLVVNISHINAPILVTIARTERHWTWGRWGRDWSGLLVELAVQRQQPTTRARTEPNAFLLERRMDPPRPDRGVAAQPSHLEHRPERHLAKRPLRGTRFVGQAKKAFVDPAFEGEMHRLSTGVKIGGNALGVPSIGVELNNRQPPSRWLHLLKTRIPPCHPGWCWGVMENPLHGFMTDGAFETDQADISEFPEVERGMLRFEGGQCRTDLLRHAFRVRCGWHRA